MKKERNKEKMRREGTRKDRILTRRDERVTHPFRNSSDAPTCARVPYRIPYLSLRRATVTTTPSPSPGPIITQSTAVRSHGRTGGKGGVRGRARYCSLVHKRSWLCKSRLPSARYAIRLSLPLFSSFSLSYVIPDVFQSRTSNSGLHPAFPSGSGLHSTCTVVPKIEFEILGFRPSPPSRESWGGKRRRKRRKKEWMRRARRYGLEGLTTP